MPILLGLFALVLTFYALKAYTRASPAALATIIKRGGGLAALSLGGLLIFRGRMDIGLALGGLGVWLMGLGRPSGMRNAGAGGSGVSRVRSAMIEMELDHSTGAISGVVLAGRHEGRPLAALSRPVLLDLYRTCLSDDPDGARLLEAYLDRRFAGWRAAGDANAHPGGFGAGQGQGRPRGAGAISEDEAYEILGLKKGAAVAEITRAHRDLMKKLHPDLGGTTDLAARVNEAKDVLLRRRQ